MELIDKAKLLAEIKRRKKEAYGNEWGWAVQCSTYDEIISLINTLEVKEVNIADMADDYYDALMKEANWMDEGTIGHCRLAYYTGCKDVLNKLQKGE